MRGGDSESDQDSHRLKYLRKLPCYSELPAYRRRLLVRIADVSTACKYNTHQRRISRFLTPIAVALSQTPDRAGDLKLLRVRLVLLYCVIIESTDLWARSCPRDALDNK